MSINLPAIETQPTSAGGAMPRRLLRLAVAVLLGLAVAQLEVAWKCRAGAETTEACVWAGAYLPLTRILYVLVFGGIAYAALSLVARARRGGR